MTHSKGGAGNEESVELAWLGDDGQFGGGVSLAGEPPPTPVAVPGPVYITVIQPFGKPGASTFALPFGQSCTLSYTGPDTVTITVSAAKPLPEPELQP